MKLSDLVIEKYKGLEPAITIYDDSLIDSVVFDGVSDDLNYNEWCIVFGNSNQINERAKTVIEKYKEGRFKKIVLCGGVSGISNLENNNESEASRIKKIIISEGIPEEDIYMDEKSSNTFENIDNAMNIIAEVTGNVNSLSIITGEYHLKRCVLAFLKKYPNIKVTTIPSYDGYADRDNWFNGGSEWNSGRCIVPWERNLLPKYVKEGKIADCDINISKMK